MELFSNTAVHCIKFSNYRGILFRGLNRGENNITFLIKFYGMEVFNRVINFLNLGAFAVGIPGEVKGLYEVYRRHGSGKFAWGDLVEPSIKLTEGIPVTKPVANAIQSIVARYKDIPESLK